MKASIPFVGASYQVRSLNVDAQRALNCYIEMDQASPRAPIALYGTPGLRKVATASAGLGCRGAITEGGYAWLVIGNYVYRMDTSYALISLGTIGSSSGPVGLVSNGLELLIVDGVAGWIVNVAAATLTQITDVDFPNGVRRAAYQDGYFIVTGDSTDQFYISALLNGGAWNGLDTASAQGSPDNTIGVISDHRELWLFGDSSAEIWLNTGNADFPFERTGNAFVEKGCASAATISKADNTVFWLGADDRGTGIVWRANGYTPMRISTHALETALAGYTLSDAWALSYQQEGHSFYVLSFPTDGKTWVYDAATQLWHERGYRDTTTGEIGQWRAAGHCILGGLHIVGDYLDGRIYVLDLDYYLDDTDPIIRLRASQTQAQLQNRLFFNSLQVDIETGVGLVTGQGSDPQLMLRYSNDGGHTWSSLKTATVGKIGEYGARCRFNRLGAGRDRVWEISLSDPVKFCVIGAIVDAEEGV
ncbi:MAG: Rhodoferax phage [Pseudomonadota bacterium]|jgi:hypothetical protein